MVQILGVTDVQTSGISNYWYIQTSVIGIEWTTTGKISKFKSDLQQI